MMDNLNFNDDLYEIDGDSSTLAGSSSISVQRNDSALNDERDEAKLPSIIDPIRVKKPIAALVVEQLIEEVINSVIPSRGFENIGNMPKQMAATNLPTKQDVINLRKMMDSKLEKAGAHKTGVCFKRREIYSQCFDELIKQVTTNCADRGLLLSRIRDEIDMTFDVYAKKYCDEISHVMRVCLEDREEEEKLHDRIDSLEAEKEVLAQKVINMQTEMDEDEHRNSERHKEETEKYCQEVALLRKKYTQLRAQLEDCFSCTK